MGDNVPMELRRRMLTLETIAGQALSRAKQNEALGTPRPAGRSSPLANAQSSLLLGAVLSICGVQDAEDAAPQVKDAFRIMNEMFSIDARHWNGKETHEVVIVLLGIALHAECAWRREEGAAAEWDEKCDERYGEANMPMRPSPIESFPVTVRLVNSHKIVREALARMLLFYMHEGELESTVRGVFHRVLELHWAARGRSYEIQRNCERFIMEYMSPLLSMLSARRAMGKAVIDTVMSLILSACVLPSATAATVNELLSPDTQFGGWCCDARNFMAVQRILPWLLQSCKSEQREELVHFTVMLLGQALPEHRFTAPWCTVYSEVVAAVGKLEGETVRCEEACATLLHAVLDTGSFHRMRTMEACALVDSMRAARSAHLFGQCKHVLEEIIARVREDPSPKSLTLDVALCREEMLGVMGAMVQPRGV